MGLKAAWIHRPEAIMGAPKDESIAPDWEFPSMDVFASAMERANGLVASADKARLGQRGEGKPEEGGATNDSRE
jgi:hypothetical protein